MENNNPLLRWFHIFTYMRTKMTNKLSPIALAISSFVFSQTTFADEAPASDIEVITVKGDFREAGLQRITSAITLIAENEIERRHAQSLEEILALSPNVNFSSGSQRARYFQIRGIGERSQFSEPINPSVGVILDDIEFSGTASGASLYDVSQVEVFRGPQGTRFGSSALAGVINIRTNDPTDTFEGSVKASVGNFNSRALGLVLSGPAVDKVNYRLAVEKYESDGFINNLFLNRDDVNNRDELTVRGKVAIEATEDLSIDLSFVHINFDNGYDAFSLDQNRTTFSDKPGFDRQQTNAVSARFNYVGFEKFDLLTIASLARSNLGYAFDEDWSFGQYVDNFGVCTPGTECLAEGGLIGYTSFDNYTREKDNGTLELRAVSKVGAEIFNQSTSWVAGVYYKDESTDLDRIYTFSSDFTSLFEAETVAAYAEFTTSFSDELTLTTGIRLEERKVDYANSNGLSLDPTDTIVGGKIVLSHQTDNRLIYGSINRGYKAGGVNTDGTLSDEQRKFDPEFVINYEVGFKTTYFDGDVYLRAAAFYIDRKDIQVSISDQLPSTPGNPGEFISFISNASEGENLGIEIETGWQITDTVDVYASIGLLDTEYKSFSFQTEDGEVSLSGREQAHAPSYQFNVGVNYYITDDLLLNVSSNGKDAFFFSDSHDEESEAFELLNASLTYTQDEWDVSLWGRNITDREYAVRGFFFANDARDSLSINRNYTQLGEPAVFGATFNYNF
jgi:outer membrane receptor protein involved in Fe transport